MPAVSPEPAAETRTYADRNNPAKLSGAELGEYAYSVGISRSEIARLAGQDDRLREQIRYRIYHLYEQEVT